MPETRRPGCQNLGLCKTCDVWFREMPPIFLPCYELHRWIAQNNHPWFGVLLWPVNACSGLAGHELPYLPMGSTVSPLLSQRSCVRISQELIDVKGVLEEMRAPWLLAGQGASWRCVARGIQVVLTGITVIRGFLWGSRLNVRAVETWIAGSHLRISDLVGLWWDPRCCVSNKFSGAWRCFENPSTGSVGKKQS